MSDNQPGRHAPLVDRTNGAPPILRGLTSSEMFWAAGLAFVAWLPPGIVIGHKLHPVVAVLVCGAMPIVTVYLLAGWFQRLKRDRPQGYHVLLAKRMAARHFALPDRFVGLRSLWDLGRSLRPAPSPRRPRPKQG